MIVDADDKDFDAAPPEQSEINRDNDFSVFRFTERMLRPEHGVRAAIWADPGTLPSYADCAALVDAEGTMKDMTMKTGMVVCARTTEGRIARLKAVETSGGALDTTGRFQAVVWNAG
ncbi:hypothetical protein LUX01_11415 [Streptomyces sudanensis]|uniref:hypothetical protein n=1 Tax=Streptomyces sudanensis TaxID=436397 RepID=UPI0020CEE8C6|nr:hypothetical protein [Streptomyces sudanensis]MCP9987210.1 hypothetical protein [Streptomyces sudanensis]